MMRYGFVSLLLSLSLAGCVSPFDMMWSQERCYEDQIGFFEKHSQFTEYFIAKNKTVITDQIEQLLRTDGFDISQLDDFGFIEGKRALSAEKSQYRFFKVATARSNNSAMNCSRLELMVSPTHERGKYRVQMVWLLRKSNDETDNAEVVLDRQQYRYFFEHLRQRLKNIK